MKILVVGSDKVYAIENYYVRYLRLHMKAVIHYPAQSIFNDFYRRAFVNRVLFRSGLSRIYKSINDELSDIAQSEKPDIVWVFKGMEIFPATLRAIKSFGAHLVNFNGDNPFIFSGRGSGNANVTKSLGMYDLHLTYNTSVYQEFQKRGLRAEILPFGFDLAEEIFDELKHESEIDRLCFLGNPDEERSAFIQKLADAGIPVTLYGNSWASFVRSSNVEVKGPVYGEEQWRVLRRYRVQLNLMRKHNLKSHNMRTFEVPGVGGIMLAPDTPEHRSFFMDSDEAFFFKDFEECLSLTRKLLSFSQADAVVVRDAARARSLKSGYRYEDRTMQAIKLFDEHLV